MDVAAQVISTFPSESGINTYSQRSPRKSEYYKLVEENNERLELSWPKHYQSKYGYWRPHVIDVIYEYLDCGGGCEQPRTQFGKT